MGGSRQLPLESAFSDSCLLIIFQTVGAQHHGCRGVFTQWKVICHHYNKFDGAQEFAADTGGRTGATVLARVRLASVQMFRRCCPVQWNTASLHEQERSRFK